VYETFLKRYRSSDTINDLWAPAGNVFIKNQPVDSEFLKNRFPAVITMNDAYFILLFAPQPEFVQKTGQFVKISAKIWKNIWRKQ